MHSETVARRFEITDASCEAGFEKKHHERLRLVVRLPKGNECASIISLHRDTTSDFPQVTN
jgi:hypothetical protein